MADSDDIERMILGRLDDDEKARIADYGCDLRRFLADRADRLPQVGSTYLGRKVVAVDHERGVITVEPDPLRDFDFTTELGPARHQQDAPPAPQDAAREPDRTDLGPRGER